MFALELEQRRNQSESRRQVVSNVGPFRVLVHLYCISGTDRLAGGRLMYTGLEIHFIIVMVTVFEDSTSIELLS